MEIQQKHFFFGFLQNKIKQNKNNPIKKTHKLSSPATTKSTK
jgi:hypothetical protein